MSANAQIPAGVTSTGYWLFWEPHERRWAVMAPDGRLLHERARTIRRALEAIDRDLSGLCLAA